MITTRTRIVQTVGALLLACGLFVPAGTSDQDLAEVFAAVEFAMADPSVIAQINDLGMEISLSDSPQAYADYLEAEGVRLRNAAEEYQIDLE